MVLGIFIFLLGYFVLTYIGIFLFFRTVRRKISFDSIEVKDILIPFRNEESNLAGLLNNLESIHLPKESNVILVNDHSTDNSKSVIESKGYRCIENSPNEFGKKVALKNGIEESQKKFVICNDADITYPSSYSKIVEYNPNLEFDILILPVWIKNEKGLLNQLIQLDYAQIMFATYSFKGNLGSGANMVVNRNSFKRDSQNNGQQILSGDDYFLIKECKKNGGTVFYLFDQDLRVVTKAPSSYKELIAQRARWIKKTILKGSLIENITSSLIILYSFLTYVMIISYVVSSDLNYVYLLLFKVFIDLLIFIPSLYVNKALRLLYLLPLLEMVYPFYYLAVILGTISKQNWKGRDL